ncbi:C40 family peptidase [Bacillus horti]|uniref:Cell wall-associated NlpC family hydrolase n=1 Tax=Caldalkalibacillus horti TaxID=77523 RepID=A0ABT9W3I6_9BACI|nr:SH3 domain-containing C40 family peptidase [Bacillus horti]MDQ0167815.1 cell wall-associated NlpC family hydrolase [Bacillus horti]
MHVQSKRFSKYSKLIVSATLSTAFVFGFGFGSDTLHKVEASSSQETQSASQKGKVTAVSGLNLRKGPSTNHERYKVIPHNTQVDILETVDSEWLKVKAGDQVGYVASEYIRVINPAAVSNLAGSELIDEIIETGHTYVGSPYKYAATKGSGSFDCSLFTQTVFEAHGIDLPRDSRSQYQATTKIERNEIRKGDLVFFSLGNPNQIGHVAIYIGEDKLLHATSNGVAVTDFEGSDYYSKRYKGAGRIID